MATTYLAEGDRVTDGVNGVGTVVLVYDFVRVRFDDGTNRSYPTISVRRGRDHEFVAYCGSALTKVR